MNLCTITQRETQEGILCCICWAVTAIIASVQSSTKLLQVQLCGNIHMCIENITSNFCFSKGKTASLSHLLWTGRIGNRNRLRSLWPFCMQNWKLLAEIQHQPPFLQWFNSDIFQRNSLSKWKVNPSHPLSLDMAKILITEWSKGRHPWKC